jgi:hypothetical protein
MTSKKDKFSPNLKKQWLIYLRNCYYNATQRYISYEKIGNVTFDLFENNKSWGNWDPQSRCIGINLNLMATCEADAIEGVLSHEIAHQLVTDLCPQAAALEPPHGETFQKMCGRLHLHPMYWKAAVDLFESGPPPSAFRPESLEQKPAHPILEKVKKLLALSNSPEPHEAASALSMASRLMARHNLDTLSLNQPETNDIQHICLSLNSAKVSRRVLIISWILQNHIFVKTILGWNYLPLTNDSERHIELIGRPVNLNLAKHVFYFLMERTETLWLSQKHTFALAGEKGIGAKNNFIENLLYGFNDKLDAAKAKPFEGQTMPSSELILSKDVELNKYVQYLYPHKRSTRAYGSSVSAPLSSKYGRLAGEQLNIYLPVNENSTKSHSPQYIQHKTAE